MFKIAIVKHDTLIAQIDAKLPPTWDALYDAYREGGVIIVESDEYHPDIEYNLDDEVIADSVSLVEDALREYINDYCLQFGDPEEDEVVSIGFKLTDDGATFGILLDTLNKPTE